MGLSQELDLRAAQRASSRKSGTNPSCANHTGAPTSPRAGAGTTGHLISKPKAFIKVEKPAIPWEF